MENKKIAEEIVKVAKELLAEEWSPDVAAEALMADIKKRARAYHLDRIYAASGKESVHFDGWGGGFTIWFEKDEEGVFSQVNISGEANTKIDAVFYKFFDNIVFDDKNDLLDSVHDAFNEVSDLLVELYPDESED